MHVKDVTGRYIAFGIHGLDKVQTLKDKLPGVFYHTDSLLRNGKELESNCYISSYNMRNGTVLGICFFFFVVGNLLSFLLVGLSYIYININNSIFGTPFVTKPINSYTRSIVVHEFL